MKAKRPLILFQFILMLFFSCFQDEKNKKSFEVPKDKINGSNPELTSSSDSINFTQELNSSPNPLAKAIDFLTPKFYQTTKCPCNSGFYSQDIIANLNICCDLIVCLNYLPFKETHNTYNIPFVGHVGDSIEFLYVNNQKINLEERSDLFFRQKISLEYGYNRIPVKFSLFNNKKIYNHYIVINNE